MTVGNQEKYIYFFSASELTVYERRVRCTREGADKSVTGSEVVLYWAEEIKGLSLRMYGSILAIKKYFQAP